MSSFEHLKACSAIIINYDVLSIGYKQFFFQTPVALQRNASVFI